MSDLSAFPITARWPAQHPDRLQLYSLPTPNGVKVSIALEEIGLPYEPHLVDIGKNESWTPEFLSLNPERQDPGDHRSRRPGRQADRPVRIRRDPALSRREDRQAAAGGSGAALRDDPVGVLPDGGGRADVRPGRLFSTNSPARTSPTSARWSAIATNPSACSACSRRASTGRHWIMGDEYTIADISLLGWVRNLIGFYGARELVDFDSWSTSRPGWSAACAAGGAARARIPKRP